MKAHVTRAVLVALCGLLASSVGTGAHADAVADSFRDKQVTIYIGASAGGGYDFYGRMIARHLGKHIPGQPTVVPSNMPGAGSLRAANYLYEVAPKDGTALGIITQSVALEEALSTPGARFKAAEFVWIGRASSNVEVTITRAASRAKTVGDVMKLEIPVAGTGPGLASVVYPTVMNNVVGTKFKVVPGYPGSTEAMLAVERGEVDGALTSWNSLNTTQRSMLSGTPNLLVQYTAEKHSELPNVPTMVELGQTAEKKSVLNLFASGAVVGRSLMAPPNLPPGHIKALRDAFQAMLRDPAFLDEVKKTQAEIDPMPGEQLQKVIEDSLKVSSTVRQTARAARGL